ncbi:MAG: hypothetical protein M1409_03460 [Actinobacteria bacterium]|nr:hypothetical protein [Actinomycetota bacterium]
MNLQIINYFSFFLFVLGLFGISYYKNFLSTVISMQIMFVAGIINFFSFAEFLYQEPVWDKIFVIFSAIVIYLLLFSIVFYKYSKQNQVYGNINNIEFADYKLFKIEKTDWWGDDKIVNNQ